ncbi:fumarylacetoacetate hydrolase [Fistulina hepatica ATCC 64428]|uniref:Fumarylacetoacetate hydrolase n=1 Tax=Fistulina hepatica ATCC 64428 TaxID=1128425 RepID=A0A0D7AID4_9AGAR|nr:fumarylacetoacetate hydrolase [Fistulina hepatica ATCC 64428]
MTPIRTQWRRLIRFVAAETSRIHIGEPVDASLDVGLAFHEGKPIKAHEILGDVLNPTARVTSTVLTVKRLLAPISREEIKVVRCLGLNYSDHAAETKMAFPKFPVLFYKPVTSLINPADPVIIPRVAQPPDVHQADYEVELTIVIGRTAKNVSEADALDYVLGYTGANDVSFRKYQLAVSQWGFSKSFDDTNPLGPCLVSAVALGDPQAVPLSCTVNGVKHQDGTTAGQIFGVAQTVSFLSQGTTFEPGTIILTGTPKGVGFVKKPPLNLKHGDNMCTWVGKGIGSLYNSIIEEGREAKL